MNKGIRSLALKIEVGIILVELLALAVSGAIYTQRFLAPLEADLKARMRLPVDLMISDALTYDTVQDKAVWEDLVGAPVLQSLVIGRKGIILAAWNTDLVGDDVATVADLKYLEERVETHAVWRTEANSWIYIAPLRLGETGTFSGYLYLEIGTGELQQQRAQIVQTFVWGSLWVVILTSVLLLVLLNGLVVKRVNQLLTVSQRVRAGDLSVRAPDTTSPDELGVLQRDMNALVIQLASVGGALEQRVQTRTAEVAHLSSQLQAVMDIGSVIVSIRDLGTLLNEATRLIGERLGFTHVGIFLLDEEAEFVVLRAVNSELGQTMLARDVRLPVGGESVVGYVAAFREPYISKDMGAEGSYDNYADLPAMRSEMALPLMIANRLLGVVDIQSRADFAFAKMDMRVLRVLANQIAVALDNARLVVEMQVALEAQQRVSGEVSEQAWTALVTAQNLGYISDDSGEVQLASSDWSPGMVRARREGRVVQEDDTTVAVPIKVRSDEALGVVKFRRPEGADAWTPQQVTLLETLTDRLAQSMESARLYEDSQRLAAQERLVGAVSNRIRESLEVESVLQAAAREIGEAFDLSDVVIRLGAVEDFIAQSQQYVPEGRPATHTRVSEKQGES